MELKKAESNLPEVREIYKGIIDEPGKIFDLIQCDIKAMAEKVLGEILKQER
jgi:hypothetical protein